MIDSIWKKIKVVQGVTDAIGLKNIRSYHIRAENLEKNFDFVITRAVAPMSDLVNWSKKKITCEQRHTIENGIIALKGGNLDQELAFLGNKRTTICLSDYFKESFFETKKIIHVPIQNI